MRKGIKEKIEILIGKIILLVIQSVILMQVFLGFIWCIGKLITIMEANQTVKIIVFIIAIIISIKEILDSI